MQNGEKKKLKRSMGLSDLVMFNIVAIVGLRWVAIAAGNGPQSIFLWFVAFLLFFIPSAFIVMELSSRFPQEGGIYVWTRQAFGEFDAYMCGFCYWVNNLIYYPSLLIFLSGIFLYVAGTKFLHLDNNPVYAVIFSLIALWFVVIMNMVGLKTGKWIQNLGSLGSWIPALFLIVAGVVAYFTSGSANTFSGNLIPDFKSILVIAVISKLCFGFAGFELQSCMGEEIEKPRINIPRAIIISGIVITVIYILGTTSLLVILPSKDINIISGVIQVIAKVGEKVGILWITPILAFLITLGGLGGCGACLSATARIPFVIGIDRYLPEWIGRVHPKWGTPANAILVQGIFSTVFILMALGGNLKDSYLALLDATIVLYFIPYIYMFLSFIVIKMKDKKSGKKSPGIDKLQDVSDNQDEKPAGKQFDFPLWLGVLGLITTVGAILLAIAPPPDMKNVGLYELKVVGGSVLFILIGIILFFTAKKKNKKT
ncbi:MAG: APC family permease [Candidatus Eremiobacteraeota bacterium]|nr:APC family permease [Candidatus Eremiobacteraeota bacterium]